MSAKNNSVRTANKRTLPDFSAQANWQIALADAITDLSGLLAAVKLDAPDIGASATAVRQFPLRVPRGFVARMRPGDPNDPLLLQVLPHAKELEWAPGFSTDPLQEKRVNYIPGLLHKYHGRVLLTVTSGCAVNCRYCFRRHFPYEDNNPGTEGWNDALEYIAAHADIREVIFSGGDPLLVKDAPLGALINKIAQIPHVKRLRIHTRLPVVLPERVTPGLVNCLTATRLQPVVVVHCNHANEIDDHVRAAIRDLTAARITVFNQSVLLKGVNDSVAALLDLSEALFAAGVVPYYLHLLDKVQGSAHFEVSETEAQQLLSGLLQQLPGYLVPKLVREQPGAKSKLPLAPG